MDENSSSTIKEKTDGKVIKLFRFSGFTHEL